MPEIASRAHLELVNGVIGDALVEAGVTFADLDAVGATHGPGLAGALLVGVSAGKAIALARDIPYVGVNHLEAHLHAAWLQDPGVELPLAVLLVSGGHTMLVAVADDASYRVLGQTVDDAAGEAYDKVARLLDLGYPGGPVIDRLAATGDPRAVRFPRPMRGDGLDFSFSGLKTAVLHQVPARVRRRGGGPRGVVPGRGRRRAHRQARRRGRRDRRPHARARWWRGRELRAARRGRGPGCAHGIASRCSRRRTSAPTTRR